MNGRVRRFATTTGVTLVEKEPHEVELVARLGRPDGVPPMAVHRIDGRLFRPVRKPGSWESCRVEDFAEAVQGRASWLDDPFNPRRTDSLRAPEPSMARVEAFREFEYRKTSDSRFDEDRAATFAAAAKLVVVDGELFMPCDDPILVVKSLPKRDAHRVHDLRITWCVGELSGDDDPVTGHVESPRDTFLHRRLPPPPSQRTNFAARPWRVFDLRDLQPAAEFARELAGRQKSALEDVPDDLVDVVEGAGIGAPRLLDHAFLVGACYGTVKTRISDMSRASVLDWLDARDARNEGRHLDVVESLVAILRRPGDAEKLTWGWSEMATYSSQTPSDVGDEAANLLRYDLYDRERIASSSLDADDAAALADAFDSPGLGFDRDEPSGSSKLPTTRRRGSPTGRPPPPRGRFGRRSSAGGFRGRARGRFRRGRSRSACASRKIPAAPPAA